MTGTDWVQYTHLDKLYGYLPGLPDAVPAVLGMTPEQYAAAVARFDRRARHAAEGLLDDPAVGAQLDALPDGVTMLAVGDSLTDDLQSWCAILGHALDLRRPRHELRLINGGLSAHTTAMVLRRWPATVAAIRPDVVVCALGGNDVTRVGPEPTRTVVSLPETVANLRELHRIAVAQTGGPLRWIWVTPVPVVEHRVAQHPAFRFGRSTWRTADVTALAAQMCGFAEPVVDLTAVFGVPADPDLQGDDGVHPTLDGQAAIARAVLATWAEITTRPTSTTGATS